MSEFPYAVASETALLQQVVVHTPGAELNFVSPGEKDDLLFDDILHGDLAKQEHDVLCELFRCIVGRDDAVIQFATLLRETLALDPARIALIEGLIDRAPKSLNYAGFRDELLGLSPDGLFNFVLTGQAPFPIHAGPIPNLLFTRDLAAVVGSHVVLNQAATVARRRETVLIDVVMRHHPMFAAGRDHIITLPTQVSFEGGDLLVVNEELVLIGQSERTSMGGVMSVARELFARTKIRKVLMVCLPHARSCMHLDTVFTFVNDRTCVVFPPIIEADTHNVFEFSAGDDPDQFQTRRWPSLKIALNALTGIEHSFIACGGSDPLRQEREQWTDGANLFAVAPNVVVAYERNLGTFEELKKHDFHIVDAEKFLGFYGTTDVPADQRIAIKLTGHELSRGRGGPRCMTMPLRRAGSPS